MEGNKRIDQSPGGIAKRGYYGIMRNQDNSETEKFTMDTIVKSTIGNYEWLSSVAFDPGYALNDIVTREEKIYKSLANANDAIPGNDPSKWAVQVRGNSGGKYNAGVYLEDDVWVLRTFEDEFHIVQLVHPTRPFISTDFITEYTAGKWVSITQNVILKALEVGIGFVNIDMGLMKRRLFVAPGIIDSASDWAMLNQGFGIEIPSIAFTMGATLSVQTFPSDWTLADVTNADWDNVAKTWKPLVEGNYVATLNFDSNNNEWRVVIKGPF